MPDNVVKTEGKYQEDENFVPDPTAQYGTLDTSGTAGAAHSQIEEVTPIFEVADAQVARTAARAIDPDDDDVPSSLVILPDSDRSREDAEKAVKKRADKAKDVDVSSSRQTKAQRAAAEDTSGDRSSSSSSTETTSTGGDEGTRRGKAGNKDS